MFILGGITESYEATKTKISIEEINNNDLEYGPYRARYLSIYLIIYLFMYILFLCLSISLYKSGTIPCLALRAQITPFSLIFFLNNGGMLCFFPNIAPAGGYNPAEL